MTASNVKSAATQASGPTTVVVPVDPAVLAPEENRRTVLTLSFEQVRRKINRSSIGRWKNYAFAFGPEWDALATS